MLNVSFSDESNENLISLGNILNKDTSFTEEDMTYIVHKTDNRDDYVLLNMIERKLIEVQGKDFIKKSHMKIEYIMGLILKKEDKLLYDFYSGSLQEYISKTNNESASSFNLTFVCLIHMAIKILRQYAPDAKNAK